AAARILRLPILGGHDMKSSCIAVIAVCLIAVILFPLTSDAKRSSVRTTMLIEPAPSNATARQGGTRIVPVNSLQDPHRHLAPAGGGAGPVSDITRSLPVEPLCRTDDEIIEAAAPVPATRMADGEPPPTPPGDGFGTRTDCNTNGTDDINDSMVFID